MLGRPAAHVGTDFGDEAQRGVRGDGVDPREVGAGELMEGGSDLEARFVVTRLA
jgi:hypothetical protein